MTFDCCAGDPIDKGRKTLLRRGYSDMKRKIDSRDVPVVNRVTAEEDTQPLTSPAYGTRVYWESRYQSFFEQCQPVAESQTSHEAISSTIISKSEDQPEPGHPWYFTYDELKPLLLPLVIGEPVDDLDESSTQQPCIVEDLKRKIDHNSDSHTQVTEETNASQHIQPPIIKKILEIGCGDVPLGVDLWRDIHLHYKDTNPGPNVPNYHVTCFDYSESVIQHLNTLPLELEKDTRSLAKLEFKVHDARVLPYKDQVFSLIIDKGTIDAQMSDIDHGYDDCMKMVYEAARLLVYNGCIFLVSHFNASVPSGMVILNDVILPGLQMLEDERVSWVIEMHGNFDEDADIDEVSGDEDEEDDEEEDSHKEEEEAEEEEEGEDDDPCDDVFSKKSESEKSDNDASSPSLGPVVYIIKKQEAVLGQEKAITVEFHSH